MKTRKPKLEEARRRWGRAVVIEGAKPKPQNPKPAAPAVALRRAA